MKKFLLIALIAFGINAKAQIALENTYSKGNSNANNIGVLRYIHLTSGGYKYSFYKSCGGNTILYLYNLNHSLYKAINVPPQTSCINIFSVSDELFNTNPSDIEYLLSAADVNFISYIKVYDENGNVLFSKDSVTLPNSIASNNMWSPIFYTTTGVKMILYRDMSTNVDSSAFVYSLPGILPCNDCTGGVISGLAPTGGGYGNEISISNSYPNPTINSTRIDYTFPSGANQGEIVFYDLQGKEIKRYKVDKTFDHLLISTADIPAGTYFFQLQIPQGGTSEGKKMVVIK